MNPPDNPNAFPSTGEVNGHDGMTLRDWFAGLHMAAMTTHDLGLNLNLLVYDSYMVADLMLRQREVYPREIEEECDD